jgi:hypothetical protein
MEQGCEWINVCDTAGNADWRERDHRSIHIGKQEPGPTGRRHANIFIHNAKTTISSYLETHKINFSALKKFKRQYGQKHLHELEYFMSLCLLSLDPLCIPSPNSLTFWTSEKKRGSGRKRRELVLKPLQVPGKESRAFKWHCFHPSHQTSNDSKNVHQLCKGCRATGRSQHLSLGFWSRELSAISKHNTYMLILLLCSLF